MPLNMRSATFLFLLAVFVAGMSAQTKAPSADVTLAMSADTPEYCAGPMTPNWPSTGFFKTQNPDDIVLRLPVTLQYQNHRSETIILPPRIGLFNRMIVPGRNEPIVLRDAKYFGGLNVNAVTTPPHPDAPFDSFSFSAVPGGNLLCLLSKGPGCSSDTIVIPVVDHSSQLDLRGKTIQIVMTRDHSLQPALLQKLTELWKASGTVWSGAVESSPLTFRIQDEPFVKNCWTSSSKN
jgi:hypothetical protein